jgi:hypothetical protein
VIGLTSAINAARVMASEGLAEAYNRPAEHPPFLSELLSQHLAAGENLRCTSLAARHAIDPLPGLGIDQNGRVDLAAAQREVINAEHPRHADLGQGQGQQQAQRGMPGERDSQPRQQPRTGPAG